MRWRGGKEGLDDLCVWGGDLEPLMDNLLDMMIDGLSSLLYTTNVWPVVLPRLCYRIITKILPEQEEII